MISDRLRELIKFKGYKPTQLANETGMEFNRWNAVYYKRIRAGEDHIDAICKLWPEFAYWLVSGKTLPGEGQTSPELERLRKDSQQEGTG